MIDGAINQPVIENCTGWKLSCLCVYMCAPLVTEVLWGGAVRVQDTRYGADDVSKLSLWTATLSQQESVEIGERGRREEKQEQEGDTGRIVPLSDSPFSLISTRSSYRKPDRKKKKNRCRFLLLCLSNFSFSLHALFLSPSILVFIENLFFCITGLIIMRH